MKKLFALLMITAVLCCVSCSNTSQQIENHDDHDHGQTEIQDESVNSEVQDDVQQEVKKPEGLDDYSKKPSKQEIEEKAAAALEILNKVPEYPASFPELSDVVEMYHMASEAIGWIASAQKIALDSSDMITKNDIIYHRVKPEINLGSHKLSEHASQINDEDKLIYNLETLEAFLCTFINPEEVKEYMIDNKELKKFVEGKNGALYAIPFSYIPQGYGKDSDDKYTLTQNSNTSYTFTVDYALVDSDGKEKSRRTRSYDFVKINGRWVFDNFVLIKQ